MNDEFEVSYALANVSVSKEWKTSWLSILIKKE